MSTLAVVEEILRETRVPMSVREIVERAGERLPTKSKTPDTVVARDLSMDIKKKGESSKFIRTAPGRYTMRELVVQPTDGVTAAGAEANGVEAAPSPPQPEAPAAPTSMISSAMNGERAGTKPAQPSAESSEERAGVSHH
jgi:hypothetical protein